MNITLVTVVTKVAEGDGKPCDETHVIEETCDTGVSCPGDMQIVKMYQSETEMLENYIKLKPLKVSPKQLFVKRKHVLLLLLQGEIKSVQTTKIVG